MTSLVFGQVIGLVFDLVFGQLTGLIFGQVFLRYLKQHSGYGIASVSPEHCGSTCSLFVFVSSQEGCSFAPPGPVLLN